MFMRVYGEFNPRTGFLSREVQLYKKHRTCSKPYRDPARGPVRQGLAPAVCPGCGGRLPDRGRAPVAYCRPSCRRAAERSEAERAPSLFEDGEEEQ